MRTRTPVLVGLGLLLGVLVLSGPVTQAQGDKREEFTLTQVDKKETVIETDFDGDGEGDAGEGEVGWGPLELKGKGAGNQRHECTFYNETEKSFLSRCSGTFYVKGRGSIEVAGTLKFTRGGGLSSQLAIVGGTGEFGDAGGKVSIDGTRTTTKFKFQVVHN